VLLFVKVHEPPVSAVPEPRLRSVLAAPFRDPDFRSFISFTCFWHVAAMVAAPFISFYLLEHVHMDVYHLLLLWTFSWAGGAMFSGRLGQLAERFGNRPVLVLCTAFKSTNVIALLLVPRDPTIAFWILIPVFMIDALLNAGIAIANNGFMIKNSPAENRTMFIAAGTAAAGMAGGVTSVVAGAALWAASDWSVTWGGTLVSNFHVIFAISLVLRLAAAVLARRVREPAAHDAVQIVVQLFRVTPLRILRFPVGLYRSLWEGAATQDARRRKKRRKRRVVSAKL
ncbi:MAG: MFS transporter, partial [Planctomycetaceae bacterium]